MTVWSSSWISSVQMASSSYHDPQVPVIVVTLDGRGPLGHKSAAEPEHR